MPEGDTEDRLECYVQIAERLVNAVGGKLGPCSHRMRQWLQAQELPDFVRSMLCDFSPDRELWAGAGVVFEEAGIVRWNDDFPEALNSDLLILGSASNGDHIAVDLNTGETGYINHEVDWPKKPRSDFIAVAPSFGVYLRDINETPSSMPDDYFAAARLQGISGVPHRST